tara:strand:- start:11015 stop:11551 length:537 start_codon:yes stop_codon:yes gene_type:complete
MAIFSRLTSNASILISCFCVSLVAQAEVNLDVTQNSFLIQQTQISAPYYTLPTSAMRKVNGVIGAEYNLSLSGQLSSYTWEMMPGLSAKMVHEKALTELKAVNVEVLYQCHGRSCGSSNQWANQVFHQSRLYGLDSQQSYAALKQDTLKGQNYYALYSTERGNKKVYLHLEMIKGSVF